MATPPAEERERLLAELQRGVDVLVIGGGITGAGVALDAATRGYRVGLVEQSDYASGTSGRSTKLIHGGLRYLPQLHVGLVREALAERRTLLRLAPGLVRPLAFLVPVYKGMRRPLGLRLPRLLRPFAPLAIHAGLAAYDLLARGELPHRRVTPREAVRLAPGLRTEGLRAVYLYYDAQTDDVRLTLAVLAGARLHGAVTLNYTRAAAIRPGGGGTGDAAAVTIEDGLSGRQLSVRARHVVNAAGVWAEGVAALAGPVPFRIAHSKGAHLILDAPGLLDNAALVLPETDDGRLAFLIPWRARLVLGTTDEPYGGDVASPRTETVDAAYLLDHLNRCLASPVGPAAITGAYAGLRPLIRRSGARPSDLSRDHQVIVHGSGMVSIIGGKLTTYRRMAEDVVDTLQRRDARADPCRTRALMLQAEVDDGDPSIAWRAEQAVMLADVMIGRTRLALLDPAAALRKAAEVAALMARDLGWSDVERERQIADFHDRLNYDRAFLDELRTRTAGGQGPQAGGW